MTAESIHLPLHGMVFFFDSFETMEQGILQWKYKKPAENV